MPVSKRTRFEVLRRDGHRCRYCGATAGESELTVDHVTPVALGGSDDPGNLVAACRDCNAGKSSSAPDASSVAQVNDDAVRWAAARHVASERLAAEVEHRTAYRDGFLDAWNSWGDFAHKLLPSDWIGSVTRWQEQGLPLNALVEAVDIAMGARVPGARVFTYMCGVVKRRMADRDAATQVQLPSAPGAFDCEHAENLGLGQIAQLYNWPHKNIKDCGLHDGLAVAHMRDPHRMLEALIDGLPEGGSFSAFMAQKMRWVA